LSFRGRAFTHLEKTTVKVKGAIDLLKAEIMSLPSDAPSTVKAHLYDRYEALLVEYARIAEYSIDEGITARPQLSQLLPQYLGETAAVKAKLDELKGAVQLLKSEIAVLPRDPDVQGRLVRFLDDYSQAAKDLITVPDENGSEKWAQKEVEELLAEISRLRETLRPSLQ
jgi:hypothetical protein